MSGVGGLDLRVPIGGLFTVLGILLAGYGVATRDNVEMYERSTAVNVNLWWGLAMLVFGIVFLLLAMRSARGPTARPAELTPEGRAIEEREHRTGLEH